MGGSRETLGELVCVTSAAPTGGLVALLLGAHRPVAPGPGGPLQQHSPEHGRGWSPREGSVGSAYAHREHLHLIKELPLNKCYPTVFELLNKPHPRAQLPEGSLAGPACSMASVLINIPSMPTYKEGKSSPKGIQVCLKRGGVGWTNKDNAADRWNPTQGPLVESDV